MKKINYITVLICFFIFFGRENVIGQNNLIQLENIKKIDSIEEYLLKDFCHSNIIYNKSYKKKYLLKDLLIFDLLNNIFNNNMQMSKLMSLTKKVKLTKVENKNGLVNNLQIIINGNYLNANIALSFIDSSIINIICSISFTSNGICSKENFKILDFYYLKNLVAKNIKFPIQIRDIDIVAKKFDTSILKSISNNYPLINFNLPSSKNPDWLNTFFLNQYSNNSKNYYSNEYGDTSIIKLIKENKSDVLKSLIYSPNYFYSINAMEAIVYLGSINKIIIDDNLKNMIILIRKNTFQVTIQHTEDSFITVKGYNEIANSDEAIIRKIRNSL